jgi:hypothetical protein
VTAPPDADAERLAAAAGERGADPPGDGAPGPRREPSWSAAAFAARFEQGLLEARLADAAATLRERRRRAVEAVYDCYVALLFGEGSGDHEYDPTLVDAVRPPDGRDPDESARRRFALALGNRLLFVRLLEDREVLPEGFLADRVAAHDPERASRSLYAAVVRPLLSDLSVPPAERAPRDRESESESESDPWAATVPYLGPGLFDDPGDPA